MKMKSLLLTAVSVACAFTAHAQTLGYSIEGSIEGLEDGTVLVLAPVSMSPVDDLGSATVSGGHFSFTGTVSEPTAVRLMVKDTYGASFLILGGEGTVKVSGKATSTDYNGTSNYDYSGVKVSGSAMTDKYQSILNVRNYLDILYSSNEKVFADYHKAYGQARAAKDKAACDSLERTDLGRACHIADSVFFKTVDETYHKVARDNRDTFFGPLSMVSLFAYLTPDLKPWYDEFSDAAKSSQYGKMVKKDVSPDSKVGTKMPAFSGKDINGKSVTLASLCKGKKYVLLDFWASWCMPCRKEIPNVKAQYEKYRKKGFEVISVSIDKKDADWRKAVSTEALTWPNLRDVDGSISKAYEIKAVPTMYLITADGTVVAENARGEVLRNKLAELF